MHSAQFSASFCPHLCMRHHGRAHGYLRSLNPLTIIGFERGDRGEPDGPINLDVNNSISSVFYFLSHLVDLNKVQGDPSGYSLRFVNLWQLDKDSSTTKFDAPSLSFQDSLMATRSSRIAGTAISTRSNREKSLSKSATSISDLECPLCAFAKGKGSLSLLFGLVIK